MSTRTCPNCGAEVPTRARACPECGADDQTGWADPDTTAGLSLPDTDFNYDDFVQREFGRKSPVPHGLHWFWWAIAVLVLAAFIFFYLRGLI